MKKRITGAIKCCSSALLSFCTRLFSRARHALLLMKNKWTDICISHICMGVSAWVAWSVCWVPWPDSEFCFLFFCFGGKFCFSPSQVCFKSEYVGQIWCLSSLIVSICNLIMCILLSNAHSMNSALKRKSSCAYLTLSCLRDV